MKTPIIQKYLAHYAEPEARDLLNLVDLKGQLLDGLLHTRLSFSGLSSRISSGEEKRECETTPTDLADAARFHNSFVLPIYDESRLDLERFLKMPDTQGLFCVWVFNAPEGGDDQARARTEESMRYFIERLRAEPISDQCYFAVVSESHCLILVDRCSIGNTLDKKQGVGLARKIGMDIVVALSTQCDFGPWIHCSDADASLPPSYFTALNEPVHASVDALGNALDNTSDSTSDSTKLSNEVESAVYDASAIVYPFSHCPEQGIELACAMYEFRLQYYLEQLQRVGSPYAYHALGSTMAVRLHDYCLVRGMPKRAAGEDFYLLNKLAKLGGVQSLSEPSIKLAGRPSIRVPFGTGPAIKQISEIANAVQEYRYYHPESFKELGSCYNLLNNTAAHSEAGMLVDQLNFICSQQSVIGEALRMLKFPLFVEHVRKQAIIGDDVRSEFDRWFDAFKTLKFVHACRDLAYPDVTIQELQEYGAIMSSELKEQYHFILQTGSAR